jgi:hypothetical protein
MSAAAWERLDLHNINVDFEAASDGLCGFLHMPTGRLCHLSYGHSGACDLRHRGPQQARPLACAVGPQALHPPSWRPTHLDKKDIFDENS